MKLMISEKNEPDFRAKETWFALPQTNRKPTANQPQTMPQTMPQTTTFQDAPCAP